MSGSSLHENVRIVGCRHTADRACTRVSALRISAPMSWYSCLYTAVKNNARKRAIFSCYGKGAENCTSVRPSARPSVRPSARHKFHRATKRSKLREKSTRFYRRWIHESDLKIFNHFLFQYIGISLIIIFLA